MDQNRRSTRNLDQNDQSKHFSTDENFRSSTIDSGRGTLESSERSSTIDSQTREASTISSIRPTPVHDESDDEENENNRPICVSRLPVLGAKCYEQAFVSYIDHPSAFFLQLAQYKKEFRDLDENLNKFYSSNAKGNCSENWNLGDYCVAKFTDGRFYRARIIDVPERNRSNYRHGVVYIDYGNCGSISPTEIYRLKRRFARLPAQAVACSLTKTLPQTDGTYSSAAIKRFKELAFEKQVDATFYLKNNRELWPLCLVDLKLSLTKEEIRPQMANFVRQVQNNETIFVEFHHLWRIVDYLIYNIPYDGEISDNENED